MRGCLLGGAIGDALGAEVEFDRWPAIRTRYGPSGITEPAERARFTDDTQMTLFTAEGLVLAARDGHGPADAVWRAYQRWLHTQGSPLPDEAVGGWLLGEAVLFARRAPGNTRVSAIAGGVAGGTAADRRINDSKGCGGVMRAAPAGFAANDLAQAFELGCEVAALTHTHPSGYLAAGVLAAVVHALAASWPLKRALDEAISELVGWPEHDEVEAAVRAAHGHATQPVTPARIAELGEGWVAEEALAIALCCVLATDDVAAALRLSVNHDGDSDSTGAIAGNLLGARFGEAALPDAWLVRLEGREVVEKVADALTSASP